MAKKASKKNNGRPSTYTQEIADDICSQLAEGISLRTVCIPDSMPSARTVFRWLRTDEKFCQQYARAKEESADAMAEDILDIADDGTNDWMTITLPGGHEKMIPDQEVLQRSKLRVDTRKWIMSKMKPKKYGDKMDVTTGGEKLPTPLLHVIRDNNSNSKDSETLKED